jgi:hypothetical protein
MHIRIEPDHPLPDLRRAPAWLVLLQARDQRLDLERQLIGVAIRPPRAVGQPFQADLVVAGEDLVAGLARDAELPAQRRHLLPVQRSGNKPQPFIHGPTRLPGHLALPQKARLCNPCLRYELSPLSQEGQCVKYNIFPGAALWGGPRIYGVSRHPVATKSNFSSWGRFNHSCISASNSG